VYDMYPWDGPADSASAEPRHVHSQPRHVHSELRPARAETRHVPAGEPAAATRAVQVALDRRDNGGDAAAAAGQPTTLRTAGRTRK